MTPLPPHRAEREALCDLMLELGPDAPTLCEGWATTEMAAHLIVRERNPIAGIGIVVSAAERLHDGAIARAKRQHGFEELVVKVRNGPPFGPMRWLDATVNTQEFFVHHEDVRRGGGDTSPRPEDEVAEVEAALWHGVQRGHRLLTRSVKGIAIDLVSSSGERVHSGKGDETVSITGRPGELVLYLLGRRTAAQVQIEGSPEAVAVLEGASLGI